MFKKLLPILIGLLGVISSPTYAEVWTGRYGVGETFDFKLYNADGTLDIDEADGGTEVSLSCAEGTQATATNDFVDEGDFYSITLTNAEMQCERIAVVIAATTTEVFFIQTINSASAMNPTVEANVASATSGSIDNADFATAPGAAGGLLIAGTNADFDVTANSTFSGGLTITQSTSNASALVVTGNGTGHGAAITSGSGATGNGIHAVAASTNGNGINAAGTGTGSGLIATGGATGDGLEGVGGATSGNGFRTAGTAGNSAATNYVGQGSAPGLLATGGATGAGISGVGGATSGVGILATGTAGNSAAMSLVGQGSGSGMLATGGATGHGFRLVGGATSGNGISTSVTAPSGSIVEWGIPNSGTLSGTHSSTTADLGTNAPGTISDLPGATLFFPTRNASRPISSYDTTTGIATWTSALDADITLTNGDPWFLFSTAPGSGSGSAPTAADVADAVWDEDMTAHQTQGTAGQVLGDSTATATSIWGLANTNLNATVSSRASQTSLDAVDDFVDTEVNSILTKVNFLPSVTAGAAGGVFIAGTNAATTVTTAFTSTFTGNLTGSVNSVATGVTVTTNNDKTGYALSATGLNSVLCTEPAAKPVWSSTSVLGFVCWQAAFAVNKITQTSTTKTLRNDADNANLATCTVSDNGTTFTLNECTP